MSKEENRRTLALLALSFSFYLLTNGAAFKNLLDQPCKCSFPFFDLSREKGQKAIEKFGLKFLENLVPYIFHATLLRKPESLFGKLVGGIESIVSSCIQHAIARCRASLVAGDCNIEFCKGIVTVVRHSFLVVPA